MKIAHETKEENGSEQELLHGLTNANQTDNSTSSADKKYEGRKKIDDSPFVMVNQDEVYFITLGQHRITEPKLTAEDSLSDITNLKWNTLINIIDAMMNIRDEFIKKDQLKKESED